MLVCLTRACLITIPHNVHATFCVSLYRYAFCHVDVEQMVLKITRYTFDTSSCHRHTLHASSLSPHSLPCPPPPFPPLLCHRSATEKAPLTYTHIYVQVHINQASTSHTPLRVTYSFIALRTSLYLFISLSFSQYQSDLGTY